MSKKKFRKIENAIAAAEMNFQSGFEAGKLVAAANVKLVLDTTYSFCEAGLDRYADALIRELKADLTEATAPAPEQETAPRRDPFPFIFDLADKPDPI